MKIDILSLFPSMFNNVFEESIIKKAIDEKLVSINVINFRDYSLDKHKKVDDTPYGGGGGMVLCIQPIYDCLQAIKTKDSTVILLTPDGEVYNQKKAYELCNNKHLIIICGHYEGFDDRIKNLCDMELSVGDYILTGGEFASMILVDSITRLIPNVIKEESHINDSFNDNLLDYPTYTKPREFMGMEVPEILLSGDHKKIENYRKEQQIKKTKIRRPDLLEAKEFYE